ncbi:MAG: PilZ domain-containing protein [Pararhodobacter sp.]
MRYRDHRWPCDYPAVLRLADGLLRTQIINISATGARLKPVDWLAPGDTVELEIAGKLRHAEVRWRRADICGLRFETPLEARDLAQVRRSDIRLDSATRKSGWNLHLRELR